jgi:hypothetical protein
MFMLQYLPKSSFLFFKFSQEPSLPSRLLHRRIRPSGSSSPKALFQVGSAGVRPKLIWQVQRKKVTQIGAGGGF